MRKLATSPKKQARLLFPVCPMRLTTLRVRAAFVVICDPRGAVAIPRAGPIQRSGLVPLYSVRMQSGGDGMVMIIASNGAILGAGEKPLRTTIALDDELIKAAQEYTGLVEKSALMREALKALIEREAARRLAALGGASPAMVSIPRRRSKVK